MVSKSVRVSFTQSASMFICIFFSNVCLSPFYYWQLFAEGEVNIIELFPRQFRGDYLTMFTEPDANNGWYNCTGAFE